MANLTKIFIWNIEKSIIYYKLNINWKYLSQHKQTTNKQTKTPKLKKLLFLQRGQIALNQLFLVFVLEVHSTV